MPQSHVFLIRRSPFGLILIPLNNMLTPLFLTVSTQNNIIYLCTLQGKEFTIFFYVLIICIHILIIYIHFLYYFSGIKVLFLNPSILSSIPDSPLSELVTPLLSSTWISHLLFVKLLLLFFNQNYYFYIVPNYNV